MADHLLGPILIGNVQYRSTQPIEERVIDHFFKDRTYLFLAISNHEGACVESIQALVEPTRYYIVMLQIPLSLLVLLLLLSARHDSGSLLHVTLICQIHLRREHCIRLSIVQLHEHLSPLEQQYLPDSPSSSRGTCVRSRSPDERGRHS